ncbi:glycoside hydrolase [Astrocystis sublimbata]|nr:glycoside hydrolase [Astrocystis sublimbata]
MLVPRNANMGNLGIVAIITCSLLVGLTAAQGDGTCSSTSPCVSGCCSKSGFCGFGPDYCGKTCVSNCDAVAECGQYAKDSGKSCPLNVCCSQYGFCGTTSEFCDTKCQSGCQAPSKPSCSSSGGTAAKRRIGYYESWSPSRPCGQWYVSDIDAAKWTHLNYAFALIDPSTFGVAQMNDFDVKSYTEFTNLKSKNPALKTFISIGGWDAGGQVFSAMVSSSANRAAFISSLRLFMKTYAFDGVDIDWEYPVADDRGGNPADFANYVTFLSELRAAVGDSYGVTATLPSSYWYLRNFDIAGMQPYLDWFNMLTYDIHGTWDGENPFTRKEVQAHTNLTEIDQALDLLWRNNIDSSKVVLGLGFYGRSFTLKDPSCSKPGCPFADGALAGPCTGQSGVLSDAEIQDIISSKGIKPVLDTTAAIKYMTWDSDQWVSYDDAETFKMKMDYANRLCLGGTMVWALDLDSVGTNSAIDDLSSRGQGALFAEVSKAVATTNSRALGIFWTPCLPKGSLGTPCPPGHRPIAWGHGKVFDADLSVNTGEGCHGGGFDGFQRALCAADNIYFQNLYWGPNKGNGKACNSKCPSGWVTLTKNSHITGQKSGCKSGKYAPLCVTHLTVYQNTISDTCPSSLTGQHLSGGLSLRSDPSGIANFDFVDNGKGEQEEGVEARGISPKMQEFRDLQARKLNKRAKAKRTAYGDAHCSDSLALDDIAIEIPGRLVFDGFNSFAGKYVYSLSPGVPARTTASSKKSTRTTTINTQSTTYPTYMRTCDGAKYPQVCYHYSSVARMGYSRVTCSNLDQSNNARPLTKSWNDGHKSTEWSKFIAKSYVNPNGKRKAARCERDEWPPAHFQQGRPDGWVRLLPGDQNGGIPNDNEGGWRRFCKFPPEKTVGEEGGPIEDRGNYYLATVYRSTIITLNVMSYTWKSMALLPRSDPYALTANVCYPSVLTADARYALQTNDPLYGTTRISAYNSVPPRSLTQGVRQPDFRKDKNKRYELVEGMVVVDEGNSTRAATDEELAGELGYTRCQERDCADELEELRRRLAEMDLPTVLLDSPTTVAVTATDTATATAMAVEGLDIRRPGLTAYPSRPTAG